VTYSRRVALPDVERLLSIPDATLRSLAERLRAVGLSAALLSKLARTGERLDDALRAPMRVWQARRMAGPAATALRALVLGDPVDRDEARAALGDVEPFVEHGLLEERDGGLVSALHLAILGDVYCLGDRVGTGGVLPVGGVTLELARATMPRAPVDAALDLGCGAAPISLLLARAARRVVATDVDPRALALARLNLRLAGVTNVELRQGDLFDPVRGERFDVVAAQPPFVALRPDAARSTFAHGGARGDELPLRLLGGVTAHLAARGRAVIASDWPAFDGDPLDARVRAALGDARANAAILASPSKNLDEYCTLYAAAEHSTLDAAFARAAMEQRDHLDALGVRGIGFAIVVVEPAVSSPWTALVPVRHPSDAPVTGEALDRIVSAQALARADWTAIAAATLRTAPGSRRVDQPAMGGAPASMIVQPAAGRPEPPAVLDADAAPIIARIEGAATVGDASTALACDGVSADRVEGITRLALLKGVLEIAVR
jgi:SAM-dependent methyltransferase